MRAIQFNEYGGPDTLHLADVDTPRAGASQLQIKVEATGVNPADFKWRGGMFKDLMPIKLPHILGYDVAGVVTEVGPDVSGFEPGDRVVASVQAGYAEFAVALAAHSARLPEGLAMADAAALPCAALTGVQMIEEGVQPKAGDTVLVTGATGGVGRFAVHAALAAGARVVAAVRPSQFDEARAIGAHAVIEMDAGDAGDIVFDHVADTVGGPAVALLCRNLAPGGRIVTVATTPTDPASLPSAPTHFRFHPDGARLAALVRDVASGQVSMPVARRLPLAEAAEAHRLAEAGGSGGKIILIP